MWFQVRHSRLKPPIGGQNAIVPGGLRLGTPAMTARGCKKTEFEEIAVFTERVIKLTKKHILKGHKLSQFKQRVNQAIEDEDPDFVDLKNDIVAFASELDFFYESQL